MDSPVLRVMVVHSDWQSFYLFVKAPMGNPHLIQAPLQNQNLMDAMDIR